MEHDSFFVQLASTDSLDVYPLNSCSKFSNCLPCELTFTGEWEVALVEVQYTSSFLNIDSTCAFGLFWFDYKYPDGKYGKLYDLKVPPCYIDDPSILCDFLNSLVKELEIEELKDIILFSYNKYTKKFTLNTENLEICLLIKGQLIDLIGLEIRNYKPHQLAFIGKSKDKQFYFKGKEKRYFKNQVTSWKSDADGGIAPFVSQMIIVNSFIVSSSIVRDSIFGSQFSSVLRTCAIQGPAGSRVVKEFLMPHYRPLKPTSLNAIDIMITDYKGKNLDFLESNVNVVLHFVKKKINVNFLFRNVNIYPLSSSKCLREWIRWHFAQLEWYNTPSVFFSKNCPLSLRKGTKKRRSVSS